MAFLDFFKRNNINKKIDSSSIENIRSDGNITNIKDPGNAGVPIDSNSIENMLYSVPWGFNTGYDILGGKKQNFFEELRAYAEAESTIAYCIQYRQKQIGSLSFKIVYKDKKKKNMQDERCDLVKAKLDEPNRLLPTFNQFITAFMYDLLVMDAVCLAPLYNGKGEVVSLELVDASLVKILVDERGQIPAPRQKAYQYRDQKNNIIKDYSFDDLFYIRSNPRSNDVYGYSCTEKCIDILDTLMRRNSSVKSYFTEGTIPDTIMSVNEKFTPEQMKKFQDYWNKYYSSSDQAKKWKVKFVPDNFKVLQTKSPELASSIDESYKKAILAMFDVPSSALIGDSNKATSESLRKQSVANGNSFYIKFIETTMTRLINYYFGYPDLEFVFVEEDATEPLQKAQTLQLYVGAGILTKDEARDTLGYGPLPETEDQNGEDNDINATGENRLIGQKDVKEQDQEVNTELPNSNEDR